MAVEKTVNVVFGQKGAAALTGNVTELNQGLELMQKLAAGVQKAFDFGKAGAQSLDIAKSFERMGRTAKDLEKLERALGGTVNTTRTQQLSNMAGAAGIGADQFAKLAETARTTSRIMGIDVEEAFTKVTQATTKLSARKLAAIGIIIDERKLYRELAVSLGVVEAELTDVQKRQALVNATIKAGQDLDPAGHTDSQAEAYQRLNAQMENALSTLQEMAAPALLSALQNVLVTAGVMDIAKTQGPAASRLESAERNLARLLKVEADALAATKRFGRGRAEAFTTLANVRKQIPGAEQDVFQRQAAADFAASEAEVNAATAAAATSKGAKKRGRGARAATGPGADQGPLLEGGFQAAQVAQFGLLTEQFDALGAAAQGPLDLAATEIQTVAESFDLLVEAGMEAHEVALGFAEVTGGVMVDGLAQVGQGLARAGVMALFYGESLQKGVNKALNAIFIEAATRTVFEGAASFASYAIGDARGGALHLAAAKGYAAVAVGTGVGALATGGFGGGGGGGGGSGGGGFGSPDTRDFGGGGSGGNQTTVVNVSLKMDGRKVGQAVATARRGPAPPRGQD